MDLQLSDKVVVITGGAKGIGAATVRAFLEEGARVYFVDKDEEAGEALASACAGAEFLSADLSQEQTCAEVLARVVRQSGRLDVLVNNAGLNEKLGLDTPPEQFMTSVRFNLLHYYAMTYYARPHLQQTRGNIINLGSKVSFTGQGNTSPYAAAKGAIAGLTREWALALAPEGIRVNAFMPAEVYTAMYEAGFQASRDPAGLREAIQRMIPLAQRLTTAEELARSIVFVASPVSSHTTGQWIVVDGGYTHLDRAFGHHLEQYS
jgi:NAD(P)-dependent dehydrogenase (short-subunit alcohol dehydrogenase family)